MIFSIIIPIYNSSKFISIPLDSLERQTINENKFEVIMINDGSTDDIQKKVKPYLNKHKTWKLINKDNGNWGSVINYVKKNKLAKGKYITILDSDDYFNENALEKVSKRNEDIIITKISVRKNDKKSDMSIFFYRKK